VAIAVTFDASGQHALIHSPDATMAAIAASATSAPPGIPLVRNPGVLKGFIFVQIPFRFPLPNPDESSETPG
jgi:hypothetical protein